MLCPRFTKTRQRYPPSILHTTECPSCTYIAKSVRIIHAYINATIHVQHRTLLRHPLSPVRYTSHRVSVSTLPLPPQLILVLVLRIGPVIRVERRERQTHRPDDPVGEDDGVEGASLSGRRRPSPGLGAGPGGDLQVAVHFLEVEEEPRDEDRRETEQGWSKREAGVFKGGDDVRFGELHDVADLCERVDFCLKEKKKRGGEGRTDG